MAELQDHVKATVLKCIADETGYTVEELTPEDKIVDDLGADSLSIASISVGIENELGIVLNEAEIETMETVQELIDIVKKGWDSNAKQL